MKRILVMVGIVILAMFAMVAFGPLFGIAAGIYCGKKFMDATKTSEKVGWAVAGLILVSTFLPVGRFVAGLLALWALYEIFKDKKDLASLSD